MSDVSVLSHLEHGAAGDEPRVAVVYHQRLVHVTGQLLLHAGRAVGLHRAQRGVILGTGLGLDLKNSQINIYFFQKCWRINKKWL